jgi:hypothetical protein
MAERVGSLAERGWFRIALATLLIIHGVIHAIGPLATWGLVDFNDIDGEPSVAMPDTVADALGAAWLVALALFVVAGTAVLYRRGWWIPVALVGVAVSQVLIVLWWEGAWAGTIANALILVAVWASGRRKHEA